MITDILEKSCVKITIKDNDKVINQGSGVIIVNVSSFFVLTAMHCLGDYIPEIKDIYIETQEDYKSEFKNIKVISIKKSDNTKDWVLMEVDFDDEEKLLHNLRLGSGFVNNEKVTFYGYQSISNKQFRPFNGEIILISKDKTAFQIKLSNDTFDQAGEDGQFIAQGLSGSGVYIIKNHQPFLIGILNTVNTEKAWNDDIDCCTVSNLSDIIEPIYNMSNVDFLKEWEANLEKEKTIKDIENYRLLNNDNFKHLERKNKVIYDSEEIANNNTQKQLLKHLSLQENLDQLSYMSPELHKKFIDIVRKFQDSVKDDYSKSVDNNNEAKDTKIKLQNDLKYELEKVIPNNLHFDLSDFQIIEWLLNCSLNFEKK